MTMTYFMAATAILSFQLLLMLFDMTRKKRDISMPKRDFCEGRLVYHRL